MFWLLFALVTLVICYFAFVRPLLRKLSVTAAFYARVDAQETFVWTKVKRLGAVCRNIALAIAGVFTSAAGLLPSDVLQGFHDIDWTAFFTAARAAQITGGIMMFMLLTHVVGLARAGVKSA